ncbi:amino acid ABC transporter substrate-binding protein, PAAT family (TC 3.A.1.3.-) [Shimia marina]|uniref:Glutamine-binding periplasmic protein n=2 Tax=Shimia marina TaxID=321267 RepID=A0A0P1F7E7_9RHOB|nr:Glutamine-binding periplasmic protein precursor [Shimia marina]SFD50158.1 amino acid ABC transporter substrate-binding protein, PAAT family (TC 3.A.1.3.-) [Shimia marina]
MQKGAQGKAGTIPVLTMRFLAVAFFTLLTCLQLIVPAWAQSGETLVFATVDRPPFAILEESGPAGFSIDLMRAIGDDLGMNIRFVAQDSFADMLEVVQSGTVDGAIANISITASRETIMDFSQPIFESGIQILMPAETGTLARVGGLLTREILTAILVAMGLLFGGGMIMWVFERHHQTYFDRPAKDALFPSFWWALNLVVNGGFEERMPQSRPGRFFAVLLVISSLFVVSVFVATITAAVTVEVLHDSVDSINDLDGRNVGSVEGSTSARFLDTRDIRFRAYTTPQDMLAAFQQGTIDSAVFDGPILAYFVRNEARNSARLIERVYRPENYGIALPTGSALREAIDQSLLKLREDGTYDTLLEKWFGATFRR